MDDWTREQLIHELKKLRQRMSELERENKAGKLTQEKLAQSETKLRMQYNGIPMPTYTWQRKGDDFFLIDYNGAAVAITQGKISNFLGHKLSEMYHQRPDVLNNFWECFTKKLSIRQESQFFLRTTGVSKYFSVTYSFIPPDLILIHTEDIDERKQMEKELKEAHDSLEKKVEERTAKLKREIKERKQIAEALKESEMKYRALFEGSSNPITILDRDGIILMINPTGAKNLGVPQEECIGKSVFELIPTIDDAYHELYKKVIDTGREVTREDCVNLSSGERWFWSILQPVSNIHGKHGVQAISYDITERKQREEQIKTSLKEKEVLLKEIHHRTKNNMQIISSLLDLQFSHIENEQIVSIFKETKNRIKAMALVHEKLYKSENLSTIDLKNYIDDLVKTIFMDYQVNSGKVSLRLMTNPIPISIDMAIPCGLIVNELITNCLKYAFPGERKGEIHVALNLTDTNEIEFKISDNGIGIPTEIDIRNTHSLGLQLVLCLVENQLKGSIELSPDTRTSFTIKFIYSI